MMRSPMVPQLSIASRLFLYSLGLTLTALVVELIVLTFWEQKHALDVIENHKKEIQKAYIPTLTKHLWLDNTESIMLLLNGIIQKEKIIHVSVKTSDGRVVSAEGTSPSAEQNISVQYPIIYAYKKNDIELGYLKIDFKRQGFSDHLLELGLPIIVFQSSLILVISFSLYYFSNFLITKHLLYLSKFFEEFNVASPLKTVKLPRNPSQSSDELDVLVSAINMMITNLRKNQIEQNSLLESLTASQENLKKNFEELQSAKTALEFSEKRNATILDRSIDGFWVADSNGRIVEGNNAFCDMLGYSKEDILKMTVGDIEVIESNYEIEEHIKRVIKNGHERFETQHRHKNGHSVDVEISVNFIDALGNNFFCFQRDISERKQAVEELASAKTAAENASIAKSQFLANMSHEIRTPMNVILGMNRLALETPMSDDQYKYLSTVQHSSESLLNILDDILDFSKIEAGQLVLYDRPFELITLIKSVMMPLDLKAQEKGLNLSYNITPELSLKLVGDDLRLRQILNNLVTNAIKFTETGSITVSADLSSQDKKHTFIHFSVTDTGIGIPENFQEKIFDSFTQTDSSISRRFGGTGLGLTICKKLTQLLGGKIWYESELSKGSTFHFTIPFNHDEKSGLTAMAETQTKKASYSPLDILVVEDNKLNLIFVETILSKQGHKVTVARNGQEALQLLVENSFDVILMDVQMPKIDGIVATKYIRQCEQDLPPPSTETEHYDLLISLQKSIKGKHVPIIALTAHAMSGDRDKCKEVGMDDYLTKPFEPAEVYAVLHSVAATKKPNP